MAGALRTDAEESKLVVNVRVPAARHHLALQRFHRTGKFDVLNAAADGANKIIVVVAGHDELEIGGPVVQAAAAHQSGRLQFHDQAVNRRLVESGQAVDPGKVGKSGRVVMGGHVLEQGVKPPAAAQSAGAQLVDAGFDERGDLARRLGMVAMGLGHA